MIRKLIAVLAITFTGLAWGSDRASSSSLQDVLAQYKDNNCVVCHSRIMNPLRITSRYGEWHISLHREKGVGCDKCHGGDPGTDDPKKAHAGVLPIKEEGSRLHPANQPETCKSCHQAVANTFAESKHYRNLKSAGLGPSCNTCHAHMASEVIYTGEQVSGLCSKCHDSNNALMPRRPDIPVKASETLEAIRRANMVVAWADRLLEEAVKRKMDVTAEQKEDQSVRAMLSEAKVGWHAFEMDSVRAKADSAFEAGTKLKDTLRGKLYPQ